MYGRPNIKYTPRISKHTVAGYGDQRLYSGLRKHRTPIRAILNNLSKEDDPKRISTRRVIRRRMHARQNNTIRAVEQDWQGARNNVKYTLATGHP